MMTLYLLFEQIDKGKLSLSTQMTASAYACTQDPTKLGLQPGDTLTVEDAIKALVIRSANDVAVVVAEHLAGSEYQFAQRMTAKARDLGMLSTNFVNASGLPDENQRSTAFDMMLLSRRLIADHNEFYPYFRLQSFVWGGRSYEGHNNLLKFFDGADGLKTGYTRMSGFNLASSATRQDKRLISVVMGGRSARERDNQTAQLLETEFSKLGLGRPAPVIMAMSPLVLDEEETAAAEAEEPASESQPPAVEPVATPPVGPDDKISQATSWQRAWLPPRPPRQRNLARVTAPTQARASRLRQPVQNGAFRSVLTHRARMPTTSSAPSSSACVTFSAPPKVQSSR
jgi:D-alanyl-D-alanine carboxypeptidase